MEVRLIIAPLWKSVAIWIWLSVSPVILQGLFLCHTFFQEARHFKLGIHVENELFYCGLRIRSIALILFSICPFFLYFKGKFVSQFSEELCKLES